MTTYNAMNYSATLVNNDLRMYFELVNQPYTFTGDFAVRWKDLITDMVRERLWSYSDSVMTTALGSELYGGTLDYTDDDMEHTLQKAYEEFAKTEGRYWSGNTWVDKEEDDRLREKYGKAVYLGSGSFVLSTENTEDTEDTEDEDDETTIECDACGKNLEDVDATISNNGHWVICMECYADEEEDEKKDKEEAEAEKEEDEKKPILTYKCRVECAGDIDRVIKRSNKVLREGFSFTTKEICGSTIEGRNGEKFELPDRVWTFTSRANLATVKQVFSDVEDAHVGEETVQLEADYTGKRT